MDTGLGQRGATGSPQCRQGWVCPLRLCPALLFWTARHSNRAEAQGASQGLRVGPSRGLPAPPPPRVAWSIPQRAASLLPSKSGFGFLSQVPLECETQVLAPQSLLSPQDSAWHMGVPSVSDNRTGWSFLWNCPLPWPAAMSCVTSVCGALGQSPGWAVSALPSGPEVLPCGMSHGPSPASL